MADFILTLLLGTAGAIAAGFAVRYGLILASRIDERLRTAVQSRFSGFNWYLRIPFRVGIIIEFFYYLVIGRKNYPKPNWWPLRFTTWLTLLIFPALLFAYSDTIGFFSSLISPNGIRETLPEGGWLTWYLFSLSLLALTVIILLMAESLRMHMILAPLRFTLYLILSLLFAALSLLTYGILLFYPLLFLLSRLTGAKPFQPLNRQYDLFAQSLQEWLGKRRFHREHKQHKRLHGRNNQQQGV